eukprot:scaffold5174_cov118-Isochrysis_galbana.AAC.10
MLRLLDQSGVRVGRPPCATERPREHGVVDLARRLGLAVARGGGHSQRTPQLRLGRLALEPLLLRARRRLALRQDLLALVGGDNGRGGERDAARGEAVAEQLGRLGEGGRDDVAHLQSQVKHARFSSAHARQWHKAERACDALLARARSGATGCGSPDRARAAGPETRQTDTLWRAGIRRCAPRPVTPWPSSTTPTSWAPIGRPVT